MNAMDVVNYKTSQVKMQVSTKIFKDAMNDSEQSVAQIMDMAPDVSAMTGSGKQFNMKL